MLACGTVIECQVETHPLAQRGYNELARLSVVHRARPVLRIRSWCVPLGSWVVVVEEIHEFTDPSAAEERMAGISVVTL